MAKILIDTGVFVALFDRDDKYHQNALNFIKNNRHELVTTLANITEVMYLIDDVNTQVNFLMWLDLAKITIIPLTTQDLSQIGSLIIQYHNVPMDFADGCLLHLANRYKIDKIATIDSDFQIYRIHGKYPFKWVM